MHGLPTAYPCRGWSYLPLMPTGRSSWIHIDDKRNYVRQDDLAAPCRCLNYLYSGGQRMLEQLQHWFTQLDTRPVITAMILTRDQQPRTTIPGRERQTCWSRDAVDVNVLEHARKLSYGMLTELTILECSCVERLLSTCNAAIPGIRSSLLGFGYSRSGSFDLTEQESTCWQTMLHASACTGMHVFLSSADCMLPSGPLAHPSVIVASQSPAASHTTLACA